MKKLSKKGKKWLAAGILVFLAIAVTLLATFANLDGKGSEGVIRNLAKAMNERDAAGFTSCFLPSLQEQIKQNMTTKDSADDYFDNLYPKTFGDHVTVSVSDFDTQRQEIKDGKYNGVDVTELKISAIAKVTYTMTVKGDLAEDSQKAIAICAKTEGKWYLLTMTAAPEDTVTPTDVQ